MGFNELMQELVNKDYDELLSLAKTAVGHLLPVCKIVDEENNGLAMLTAILLSAVASDGKLTAMESKFLSDLTGLDADGVDKLTDLYCDKTADVTDHLADLSTTKFKSHIIMLAACLASCDKNISREETEFIRKIME